MTEDAKQSETPFVDTGQQLVLEIYVRNLGEPIAFYQQLGF